MTFYFPGAFDFYLILDITMATASRSYGLVGLFAALGAVSAGVSCAITGISASKVQASDKNTCLTASALTGFGTIALIVALVLLFLFMRQTQKSKALFIMFCVLAGLYALMILIAGILAGVTANKPANASQKAALIAAAILPVSSLVFFIIATIVLAKHNKVTLSTQDLRDLRTRDFARTKIAASNIVAM